MSFLVGTAQTDITPSGSIFLAGYAARNKPSIGVHDKLFGKALCVTYEKENVVLVSLDLVGIPKEFVNKVREDIKKEIGIDNVIISCTHTHSGPNINNSFLNNTTKADQLWLALLHEKIIKLIKESVQNKIKARIAVGKVKVFDIGKNRRNLFVSKESEVDPELIILKVQDFDNKIRAIFLNYTCHATVLDANNYLISADYPGYIYKYLSKDFPNAVILFTNGAAGDINIGYLSTDSALGKDMKIRSFDNADVIGRRISDAALGAIEDISFLDKESLLYKSKEIKLPCRNKMPTENQLEENIKKYQNKIFKIDNKEEKEEKEIKKLYSEILLEKVRNKICKDGYVETEIGLLKINNAFLITVPGELFCKLGLTLKNIFSPNIAMIIGYSNDQIGYIPTIESFASGGYEVETSIFREDVGDVLIREIQSLI